MSSLSNPSEQPVRRHELVFLRQAAWQELLGARPDLASEPLVAGWVEEGWPLVGRRALPEEGPGVPLGLPLPPFAGKRRLSVLVRCKDISGRASPPTLRQAIRMAPLAWWPALDMLDALAARHGIQARVFGSLAWQVLTGLPYVASSSDLDLLLPFHRDTDLRALGAGLSAIEATAPMRLDGELVREDGAAVNWRELHTGARELLVKRLDGVLLCEADRFLHAESLS